MSHVLSLRLVTFLTVFLNFIFSTAQIGTIKQLDVDGGLEGFKLNSSYNQIIAKYSLIPRDCRYCDKSDSIISEYTVRNKEHVNVNGINMNFYCKMYFSNDSLFKLVMHFKEQDSSMSKMLKYLNTRYGKREIEPLSGGLRIWETTSIHLEAYLNESNSGSLVLYNKIIKKQVDDKIVQVKESELIKHGGKGNGSFIPDITSTTNLIAMNYSQSSFEKLLPLFRRDTSATSFDYNEKTKAYDIPKEKVFDYMFTYDKRYLVYAKVYIDMKSIIKKIEFKFTEDPSFINFNKQIASNGFIFNTKMSQLVSKMGVNSCSVYDSKNIHLTKFSNKHFKLEKY